jgi:transcriptional regulator with XRE-family HTH domain
MRIKPLRDVRWSRGRMSQQELARRAEVDQQTISKIETGTIKEPSYRVVIRICQALDVRPEMVKEFRL